MQPSYKETEDFNSMSSYSLSLESFSQDYHHFISRDTHTPLNIGFVMNDTNSARPAEPSVNHYHYPTDMSYYHETSGNNNNSSWTKPHNRAPFIIHHDDNSLYHHTTPPPPPPPIFTPSYEYHSHLSYVSPTGSSFSTEITTSVNTNNQPQPHNDDLYQLDSSSGNLALSNDDNANTSRFDTNKPASNDPLLHKHHGNKKLRHTTATTTPSYSNYFPEQHHALGIYSQRPLHNNKRSDGFHSRFKSANARLPPFGAEEQQQERGLIYQQFLSPPLVNSNLYYHHHHREEDPSTDYSQKFSSNSSLLIDHQEECNNSDNFKPFQFDAVLHAPTAMIKKHDDQVITYLNRGQAYLIDLSTSKPFTGQSSFSSGTITSTISIAFHEPSHRHLAENYWKYWISQQENKHEARALDLDTNQTTGVYNIRMTSFDQITFDWHARFGAKAYIRFNCLSTDFSRIKGVKGIPMRAVIQTNTRYTELPNNSLSYKGTFKNLGLTSPNSNVISTDSQQEDTKTNLLSSSTGYDYKELCYCKIKLFRDKGAERKNKDDKKQMAKQMEKVIASTNGNPQQHPSWPIISQTSKTVSALTQVPTSPNISVNDDFLLTENQGENPSIDIIAPIVATTPVTNKRKRANTSHRKVDETTTTALKKLRTKSSSVLCFYVWAHSRYGTPSEVLLDALTTQDLKTKLADVLSIHPSKIAEILWRKKRDITTAFPFDQQDGLNEVLVLVEDTFISEHISDGEMMTVECETKEDGNFRLVLEF